MNLHLIQTNQSSFCVYNFLLLLTLLRKDVFWLLKRT